ncbi:hypothetical protein OMCYN_01172 [cyanobiont of Ornithocercus magnificus]|nr:hypothetical protein OMCYN_01172 [cyanobiont of Ornithocercus magnificus]
MPDVKVVALKGAVLVLLILLVKSNLLRIKMSFVGSLIALLLTAALLTTVSGSVILAIAAYPKFK